MTSTLVFFVLIVNPQRRNVASMTVTFPQLLSTITQYYKGYVISIQQNPHQLLLCGIHWVCVANNSCKPKAGAHET